MEHAPSLAQFAGSMLAAVVGLGAVGFAGAWLMTRRQPCNPYGYDACACGCGTDCGERADG